MLSLRERPTPKPGSGNSAPVRVGDIVILKDDSTSRAFWKLGKVEELLPGNDGKVSAAFDKVPRNNGTTQFLKRVVRHLIPIEVQEESTNDQVPCQSSTTLQVPQPVVDNRPATQRPRWNAVVREENIAKGPLRL